MLNIIPRKKTRFSHPKAYIHVNVSTYASTCTFELHHEKSCLLRMRKERRKSAFYMYMYILFNIFFFLYLHAKLLQIKQELSHDSIARLNCAVPITKIRAVA